jgi:hypothetical protein
LKVKKVEAVKVAEGLLDASLPPTLSLPKGECGRARKGGTAEGGNHFNLFNDFNHLN